MGKAKPPNRKRCYCLTSHVGGWKRKKIPIQEDKWLKNGPIGGPATRDEPLKVVELIDMETAQWNENLLRSMFDDQLVSKIKNIPIGLPSTEEKLVWIDNKSRNYTVKSGYHRNQITTANPHSLTPTTCYKAKPELWKLI